jgi:hypothetical protein
VSDLGLVCKKLLDNADMDVNYSNFPDSVELIFYIISSDIKVSFVCSGIEMFSIEQNWDQDALYVVLECEVNPPQIILDVEKNGGSFISSKERKKHMWEILIQGGVCLHLKCIAFNWKLERE